MLTPFNHMVNQVIIKQDDAVKDLGVILDAKLSFDVHINGVIESSNKMLGATLRHWKLFSRLNFVTSI